MKRLNILFRIGLLAAALVALNHELAGVAPGELIAQLQAFGWLPISIAICFMIASFMAMGSFELLGLRYLASAAARRVPVVYSMATAFVANAFSQSLGVAVLTGTAVRLRAYPRFGVTSSEIVRLSTFVTLTASVGLLVTGAIAFIGSTGTALVGPFQVKLLPLGLVVAAPALLYLGWVLLHPEREYGKGKWIFALPSRGVGVLQVVLSSFDWLLAGTVLFFLLPGELGLSYLAFLPAFFIAQTLATVSHVPGGAGVFEAGFLGLVAQSAHEKPAVLAALLVYRLVYYALPLVLAFGLAAIYELIGSQGNLTLPDPVSTVAS